MTCVSHPSLTAVHKRAAGCRHLVTDGTHLRMEAKHDVFFIESYSSSEVEEEPDFSYSNKLFAKLSKDSSALPLLAFSITSGKAPRDTEQATKAEVEEREEDSDFSVEEWMILGGEDEADSNIQLNLSYCGEEDCKDVTDESVTSQSHTWLVSDKDKYGYDQSLFGRYFFPGRSSFCYRCFKSGHVAKRCSFDKKSSTCVLCGTQGHVQKNCPGRPCPDCGLPAHGLHPCRIPPVWNQHCRRCGMIGHLSFTCPDTWRQYHRTVRSGVPLSSRPVARLSQKSCAHCYNCSKRGHYGYECARIRMVRGTFPTLPYVCHYDSLEDVLRRQTRMETGAKGQIPDEKSEKDSLLQGRCKIKQGASGQAGRRKTWPERRRERRQIKQLRRKAQAIREGGLLGRSRYDSEDRGGTADLSKKPKTRQSVHPSEKKNNQELVGRKKWQSKLKDLQSKKKKKQKDLHPFGDENFGGEKVFSPNQRVRHRR
ncbi:zinc finger CCHC domain-containing protein 7 [Oryzias latipes]|uniref:Zinc finger CCHC domain-containing protein 7 n=1 Tax=Oryzias latipes TaxID=8090 RepID=A0A3B3HHT1_ORYLA|nr:zinc finger CCHC domain-containing protein 7 [Oryzias latipes]